VRARRSTASQKSRQYSGERRPTNGSSTTSSTVTRSRAAELVAADIQRAGLDERSAPAVSADLMAPQSPESDRWKTWFYYSQGSEAFRGDLHFYSVDHDLRGKLGDIDGDRCPVVMPDWRVADYLTTPEDSARTAGGSRTAGSSRGCRIGHFPMSENHERFRIHLLEALDLLARPSPPDGIVRPAGTARRRHSEGDTVDQHVSRSGSLRAAVLGTRTRQSPGLAVGAVVGAVSVPDRDHVEEAVHAARRVQHELRVFPPIGEPRPRSVARRLRESVDRSPPSSSPRAASRDAGRALRPSGRPRRSGSLPRRPGAGPVSSSGSTRTPPVTVGCPQRRVPADRLGMPRFSFRSTTRRTKVAPALAVGAPIVVKPAPATPLTALALGDLLAETDLPAGAWSILTVPNEEMDALVADPRLPVVSFTGSGPVGWSIRDRVPRKHVTLELGGTAAVVVCADWNGDADLDHAAARIAALGTGSAGQSCISVQRVIADRDVYERLVERIVVQIEAQVLGDPADDATTVGPPPRSDRSGRRPGRCAGRP
jgi:hypothetical protein